MTSLRKRYAFYVSIASLLLIFTSFYWHRGISLETVAPSILPVEVPVVGGETSKAPPPVPYHPRYKKATNAKSLPIVDNFPLAALALSPADLPPIPIWNSPPTPHIEESTPIFIGFTRNWRLLQQVVVSYITSGWPPEDIYVVENTGVMDSNKKGLLSLQNPFFLNHTRLHVLGVNVVITPTLLTFAQLQNFYIYHATQQNWEYFFWSHMDVVVIPYEDRYSEKHPDIKLGHDYSDFVSLYSHCVVALRSVLAPDATTGLKKRWAQRFFSYDRLALVNIDAFLEVGAWDTLIPFYMTDCDMHARLEMAGFVVEEVPVGLVFDVAGSLEDLVVLYRHTGKGIPEASWKDPNAVEEVVKTEKAAEAGGGVKKERMKWKRDAYAANETAAENVREVVPAEIPLSAVASTYFPPSTISPTPKTTATHPSSTRLALKTNPLTPSPYTPDSVNSPLFVALKGFLDGMQGSKGSSARGRNTWQSRQTGGQGDPFYRSPEGFEKGIAMTIEFGRTVFAEKWGHRDCDIAPIGMRPTDAWAVYHDWEPVPER